MKSMFFIWTMLDYLHEWMKENGYKYNILEIQTAVCYKFENLNNDKIQVASLFNKLLRNACIVFA